MNFALDFDETYTASPLLWDKFIDVAKFHGHIVTFVTFRFEGWGNEDIESTAKSLGIGVVYTNGRQKQHVFDADVWIDDSPETVVRFENLVKFHDGCVVNGDLE